MLGPCCEIEFAEAKKVLLKIIVFVILKQTYSHSLSTHVHFGGHKTRFAVSRPPQLLAMFVVKFEFQPFKLLYVTARARV